MRGLRGLCITHSEINHGSVIAKQATILKHKFYANIEKLRSVSRLVDPVLRIISASESTHNFDANACIGQ
jgi:hypothetical protein